MQKRGKGVWVFVLLCLLLGCSLWKKDKGDAIDTVTFTTPSSFQESKEYIIEAGDELDIDVYRHTDLSLELTVSPQGTINYPLIGEMEVAGKTPSQLRDEIAMKLAQGYVIEPNVSVNIKELGSRKVYVLGQVETPGGYEIGLDYPVSVIQAVSMAGGFSGGAAKTRVLLIRREGNTTTLSNLNLKQVMKRKTAQFDLALRKGDIVYVPPSVIDNVNSFFILLSNAIRPISQDIFRGITLEPQVEDVLTGRAQSGEGGAEIPPQ